MLKIPVTEKDQTFGNAAAPLQLVEFGDYECPYCGAAYPVIKKLQHYFGKQLLFVFRNFPLVDMHPDAYPAAQVAEASGLQNKFWPVHDMIYENQQALSINQLFNYAGKAGVNREQLVVEMNAEEVTDKIEMDIEGGARSGVNGTPSFFINGRRYDGDYDFESMKEFMAALL